MKTVVTSVAKGSWYPRGQLRLSANLEDVGFNGIFDAWLGTMPSDAPAHRAKPYAFKAYALKTMIEKHDPDVIWWIDSSIIALNNFEDITELALDEGVAVFDSGWALGQWTHDKALNFYGVNRGDAMAMPLYVGGLFAIAPKTKIGRAIFDEWFSYAEHPDLFVGDWKNKDGKMGDPERCLGHRHDMPALTVACRNNGVKQGNAQASDFVYPPTDQPLPTEGTFLAIGPRGL